MKVLAILAKLRYELEEWIIDWKDYNFYKVWSLAIRNG